jgi:CRP/FNR family cyclic AMP-dependent transcriptional regulator
MAARIAAMVQELVGRIAVSPLSGRPVGKEGRFEAVIPKVSQETLAEMIGTTRSPVSFFTNKFRKLGFIEYNSGPSVHGSLLNVVLHD